MRSPSGSVMVAGPWAASGGSGPEPRTTPPCPGAPSRVGGYGHRLSPASARPTATDPPATGAAVRPPPCHRRATGSGCRRRARASRVEPNPATPGGQAPWGTCLLGHARHRGASRVPVQTVPHQERAAAGAGDNDGGGSSHQMDPATRRRRWNTTDSYGSGSSPPRHASPSLTNAS